MTDADGENQYLLDLSRPPTRKGVETLKKRARRLADAQQSITEAVDKIRRLTMSNHLPEIRLRHGFVRLSIPASPNSSDRSAPKPEHRPPSTRLMSPNGIALKLELIALFEAQTRTQPGLRPLDNTTPLREVSDGDMCWSNYIASGAQSTVGDGYLMSAQDKKFRQLGTALDRLKKEGLIHSPNHERRADKHQGFRLMREDARRGHTGDFYRVPDAAEEYFTIPATLVTNGWIYVLEDSELALLLIAARLRAKHGDVTVRLEAGPRVLNYCLSRDSFEAHRMLKWLGLLDVTVDDDRRPNGRVENYAKKGALPHGLRFLPAGLDKDAFSAVRDEVQYQLRRVKPQP
ncbi:hypothetical protein LRS71_24455 [Rhodococcus pyridinivorans]|uniref:hypothetical protein n=1 Tax=Rhodococcus pyridinivorans TaxID=103816 RepID=UPI001E32DBE1|nr:hypothetical protein [Rhodococcus pyridinivorans]MCD5422666.1 hypothetical protein [Rhodococcus pyridinivorans]